MSNTSNNASGGINALGLLGVAFVVLKLTGHIDWSWWWVTAPFWGGIAIVTGIALLVLAGVAIWNYGIVPLNLHVIDPIVRKIRQREIRKAILGKENDQN